jgi:hypothetical protein
MFCWLFFRDAEGRLPTAQELRRRGFAVSAAALPAVEAPVQALAAEVPAPYGRPAAAGEAPARDGQDPE